MRMVAILALLLASTAISQDFNPDVKTVDNINPKEVIHWNLSQAIRDKEGRIEIELTLNTSRNFTIYQSKLVAIAPPGYNLVDMAVPEATEQVDPISGDDVQVFSNGYFRYIFDPDPDTEASTEINFQLTYTGCTDVICLFPFTEKFNAAVHPTGKRIELPNGKKSLTGPQIKEEDEGGLSDRLTNQISTGSLSLPLLLLLIFIGGVITNLTPCVYPMIPITLRLLGGQNQRAFANSSMYALGILVTYSSLGIFAASTGGMFGALLQSKAVNIFFALAMLVLGFTMLGFGNFSRFQQMGEKLGTGKPSLRNMFLMGVGAGFVASPCTGPVLGALLTITLESQDITKGALMMFTYSFGFALPYVFLGGIASKASQVKLSPRWQTLTKLVFASIMFALCLYYLRIPLYTQLKVVKPFWQPLALYGSIISIIILTFWISTPKLLMKKGLSVLPALITGISVFAVSQYVTTADSSEAKLTWLKTEAAAYATASESGKPIIIDGWAEWCEACKKMEATTFRDPDLMKELSDNWILVKLDLTEDSDENDEIIDRFGMPGLPTMVLLPPNGDLEKSHKIVGEKGAVFFLKELKNYREKL